MKLYEGLDEVPKSGRYDALFAGEVLSIINENFPSEMTIAELKLAIDPEPNDVKLSVALRGLTQDGLVKGQPFYGECCLFPMSKIEITADGRRHLSEKAQGSQCATIIHGGQFNNFGHAGAIGHHSVGTINYQQQWVGNQVDLSQIAMELQTLKAKLRETAETPTDFQQLGILAEAEQYAVQDDGPKVMEVLSKSGKWLFDFATHVGVELTAKLVANRWV